MMDNLKTGIALKLEKLVTPKDTATAYGSGHVEVFATPAMIALMEETALKSVQPLLDQSKTTVGFEVNIRHFKAVKVGEVVMGKSLLIELEGSKLKFEVEVRHNNEIVGKGQHVRYIVSKEKFV